MSDIEGRPHTTRTGRIVYDRKKHYFSLSDVVRILKKVDISTLDTDSPEFLKFLDAWFDFIFIVISQLQEPMLDALFPRSQAFLRGVEAVVYEKATDGLISLYGFIFGLVERAKEARRGEQ